MIMLDSISTGVTSLIGWMGEVLTAIITPSGSLSSVLPIIGIAIAGSVLFLGVKLIKSLVWGY